MKTKSIYKYSLKKQKVLEISEDKSACNPKEVANLIKAFGIHEEEQEHLIVLVVDSKNKVKAYYTVTVGILDCAMAHAREVFRYAILQGAARIILAHNHPSGDTAPSGKDIQLTADMKQAGKIIGIDLLDHIIVSDSSYFSFLEESLL